MNYGQIQGMLRLVLGFGGGAALTAAGFNGDAISHAVQGATTPGGLLLGVLPTVAAGLWSLYSHKVANTVDRAANLDPDATVAAGIQAGGSLPLNPDGTRRTRPPVTLDRAPR